MSKREFRVSAEEGGGGDNGALACLRSRRSEIFLLQTLRLAHVSLHLSYLLQLLSFSPSCSASHERLEITNARSQPPTLGGAGGASEEPWGVCHHWGGGGSATAGWSTSLVPAGSRGTCRPHTPGLFSEGTKVHLAERPPGWCEGRLCAPPAC